MLAKTLIVVGLVCLAIGILILLGNKIGIPFGQLPGDLSYKTENVGIYFPIATMVIISIVLTIGVNLLIWLFSKR